MGSTDVDPVCVVIYSVATRVAHAMNDAALSMTRGIKRSRMRQS